jgi:hypothetical protein
MAAQKTALPNRKAFSFRRLALGVLVLVVAAYILDFAWYELRSVIPSLGATTGSVHRIRVLAIPSRGNRVQYEIDAVHPEEDVACSHSLFPRGGNPPCWYMSRHADDPVPM